VPRCGSCPARMSDSGCFGAHGRAHRTSAGENVPAGQASDHGLWYPPCHARRFDRWSILTTSPLAVLPFRPPPLLSPRERHGDRGITPRQELVACCATNRKRCNWALRVMPSISAGDSGRRVSLSAYFLPTHYLRQGGGLSPQARPFHAPQCVRGALSDVHQAQGGESVSRSCTTGSMFGLLAACAGLITDEAKFMRGFCPELGRRPLDARV
jgi:hypothetical protein